MKNILVLIVMTCSLGFVGCAQKPEEKVKEVVENFFEALKSGDSSLAREYVIEDEMNVNLIEALVPADKKDKKYWEDVTLDAFQICVDGDEAVVSSEFKRKKETGYFNFYLKDLNEVGNWKICSFFCHMKEQKSCAIKECTVKGYKKAKKEFDRLAAKEFEESKIRKAMLDVMVFKTAAVQYYMDKRKYPKTFDDLINGADPYLIGGDSAQIDPWGNKYELRIMKRGVSFVSAGPDGLIGTEDDIDSSKKNDF